MSDKTFRPWDPDQQILFPPCIKEFVPEGHLAHFVRDGEAERPRRARADAGPDQEEHGVLAEGALRGHGLLFRREHRGPRGSEDPGLHRNGSSEARDRITDGPRGEAPGAARTSAASGRRSARCTTVEAGRRPRCRPGLADSLDSSAPTTPSRSSSRPSRGSGLPTARPNQETRNSRAAADYASRSSAERVDCERPVTPTTC